ncbi:MAG: hypothetical protein HYT87_14810 [Nitrospirae bacterium]|nr:hypothetical protein [Nitrospirota bacterium]
MGLTTRAASVALFVVLAFTGFPAWGQDDIIQKHLKKETLKSVEQSASPPVLEDDEVVTQYRSYIERKISIESATELEVKQSSTNLGKFGSFESTNISQIKTWAPFEGIVPLKESQFWEKSQQMELVAIAKGREELAEKLITAGWWMAVLGTGSQLLGDYLMKKGKSEDAQVAGVIFAFPIAAAFGGTSGILFPMGYKLRKKRVTPAFFAQENADLYNYQLRKTMGVDNYIERTVIGGRAAVPE